MPYGCKSIINPTLPEIVKSNNKYMKIYLTQVFDDEGHAATKISRKIVLGRSVTLPNLPKGFTNTLHSCEKMYFNNLSNNIKKLILNNPPNLLREEGKLLYKFGINYSIRCRSLTKYLTRISTDWVLEIAGKENIRKFDKEIGFSDPDKIKKMFTYLK